MPPTGRRHPVGYSSQSCRPELDTDGDHKAHLSFNGFILNRCFKNISILGQKGIVSNRTVLLCRCVSERQELFYQQCKLATT